MFIDIDNKEIHVGDTVIFCDGQGVLKGVIDKINKGSFKIHYYSVHEDTPKFAGYTNISFSSNNGHYLYKI